MSNPGLSVPLPPPALADQHGMAGRTWRLEFAAAALAEFEADRDYLEPGELTNNRRMPLHAPAPPLAAALEGFTDFPTCPSTCRSAGRHQRRRHRVERLRLPRSPRPTTSSSAPTATASTPHPCSHRGKPPTSSRTRTRTNIIRAYALGIITGSFLTAGLTFGLAPAKADGHLDNSEADYVLMYGEGAICPVIDTQI